MNDVTAMLARDPLRNIVLLKHLDAYPNHTQAHHIASGSQTATLVLLETTASAYDRRTYPTAAYAALIASDHPRLTRELIKLIPRGVGIVFKLASDADRDVLASEFPLERTTSVLSFTTGPRAMRDEHVRLTREPSGAMFELFESQDHGRDWLIPLLESDRAFACILGPCERPLAACFAFENYGPVWEIGGVCTPPEFRGQGFASRVVRTAVAQLESASLMPRYQVHEENKPSIRLAESLGLRPFLTITHFLRQPAECPQER